MGRDPERGMRHYVSWLTQDFIRIWTERELEGEQDLRAMLYCNGGPPPSQAGKIELIAVGEETRVYYDYPPPTKEKPCMDNSEPSSSQPIG